MGFVPPLSSPPSHPSAFWYPLCLLGHGLVDLDRVPIWLSCLSRHSCPGSTAVPGSHATLMPYRKGPTVIAQGSPQPPAHATGFSSVRRLGDPSAGNGCLANRPRALITWPHHDLSWGPHTGTGLSPSFFLRSPPLRTWLFSIL